MTDPITRLLRDSMSATGHFCRAMFEKSAHPIMGLQKRLHTAAQFRITGAGLVEEPGALI
jgi:hypothetical protein